MSVETAQIALISVAVIVFVLTGVRVVERLIYASFYKNSRREFRIPGLWESFVPQGLNYMTDVDAFLATGYMSDGRASRVYLIDKERIATYAELKNEDGSDHTGHTGGIAQFGAYVYITDENGLDVFMLGDLTEHRSEMVKVGEVQTYNDPAWCTVYNGYILTGSFYRPGSYETPAEEHLTTPAGDKNTAIATVFRLDETCTFGIAPIPVAVLSIPAQVQGLCVTDTGEVAISTSWGASSSLIKLYNAEKVAASMSTYTINGVEVPLYYLDSAAATRTLKAPPMSEEMVCIDGRLYIFNESACNKYIFGKFLSGKHLYSYDLTAE